jgi:hypothetical protein
MVGKFNFFADSNVFNRAAIIKNIVKLLFNKKIFVGVAFVGVNKFIAFHKFN